MVCSVILIIVVRLVKSEGQLFKIDALHIGWNWVEIVLNIGLVVSHAFLWGQEKSSASFLCILWMVSLFIHLVQICLRYHAPELESRWSMGLEEEE